MGAPRRAPESILERLRNREDLARSRVIGILEYSSIEAVAVESVSRLQRLVPLGRCRGNASERIEIGRFAILTQATGATEGRSERVNIMGVATHAKRRAVLAHKGAIDDHLRATGTE